MDYLSIPHYRGLKSKYNKTEHDRGVYFTTDTHEIIANDVVYTKYINSWTISDGVLTLTMSDSSTITITFNEASETEKGFLSAEDKKRLNQFDALKEQVTELTQTVEDNELVTAQALNNLNDRINNTVIDDYLSSTSTNAVQNKIITTALSSKADLVTTGDGTKYLADDGVYKEVKTGKDTTVYDIIVNAGSTLTTDQLNTLSQYVTSTDELMSFDVGLSDLYPIRGVWGKREADSDGYLFYLDMVYPGMSQYFSAISIDSTGAVTRVSHVSGVSYSETGPVLSYTNTNSGDVLDMTLVNNGDGTKFLNDKGEYVSIEDTSLFDLIYPLLFESDSTATEEQYNVISKIAKEYLDGYFLTFNKIVDLVLVSPYVFIKKDFDEIWIKAPAVSYGQFYGSVLVKIRQDLSVTREYFYGQIYATSDKQGVSLAVMSDNLSLQDTINLTYGGDGSKVLTDNGTYVDLGLGDMKSVLDEINGEEI